MFNEKNLEELQEDLQQMQLKCKRSLNIDDISYFIYFSKESTPKIWIRYGISFESHVTNFNCSYHGTLFCQISVHELIRSFKHYVTFRQGGNRGIETKLGICYNR